MLNYYYSSDDINTIAADFVTNHLISWINSEYTENLEWNSINASTNINSGQYKIVFRVGRIPGVTFDYHFWYETLDGRWANKHGSDSDEEWLTYGINPETANTTGWDLPPSYTGFYDSDILYFVISTER